MRRILTIAAGICLSVLTLTGASAAVSSNAPAHPPNATIIRQSGAVIYNSDWSGYAAIAKSGGATGFQYVTASYTVPSLNCPAEGNGDLQLTALTPGIGDFGYEDGLNAVCEGVNDPLYQAWYDSPAGGGDFAVNPGDALFSSVDYDATTGNYTLKMTDTTTGHSFDVVQSDPTGHTAAEVITVGEGGSNDGTAGFGAVHFDTIKITDTAGQKSGLSSSHWVTDELIAEGQTSGETEVQPGPLYATASPVQSAFENTWLREN